MKALNNCGCCDGVSQDTPLKVSNRPGLSAVHYRIGEHNDFKSSLLANLSRTKSTELQKLTSRSDDDFSIALLDAFSTVADVLTFYQERIINESFLNTATEQLSILELSRLIGYELSPGVAASTYLSFTIDDKSLEASQEIISGMKASGKEMPILKIKKGTQVQSVPEQDEEAQIFETIEDINGKSDWNAMRVRTFVPQTTIAGKSEVYVNGLDNNLKAGDFLYIKEAGKEDVKRKILRTEPLEEFEITKIIFQIEPIELIPYVIPLYVYFQPVSYFEESKTVEKKTFDDLILGDDDNPVKTITTTHLQSIMKVQKWNDHEVRKAINSIKTKVASNLPELHVFRKTAYLFGYNVPSEINAHEMINTIINDVGHASSISLNVEIESDEITVSNFETNNAITLDNEYPEITGGKDSYVAVQNGSYSSSKIFNITKSDLQPVSKYGMSGKSTKLTIDNSSKWWTGDKLKEIRSTTVHIQNEKLSLSQVPITDPLKKGDNEFFLSKFYIDLQPNQKIVISGNLDDLPSITRNEVHTIKEIYTQDGLTRIKLEDPLENSFIRKTVRINANVALATHGETVNEILGNGNASLTFQKFTLKHVPLTYVSGNSSNGTSTTLEVRVNDILWKEVSSLYQKKPGDHVYITRVDSESQTTIIFGDGITGSRLPTGNQNIRATYRKGIGKQGILKSNQLSQLVSKPLHLKAVDNPLPSEGAQDGEKMENARDNANLTVFTLDRIVSLQDFEDYTRAFAGIVKAKAIWTWTGTGKGVHITIAGVDGSVVPSNGLLYKNLQDSLANNAFPGTMIKIENYIVKHFTIRGGIKVDDQYIFDLVHSKVINYLQGKYSFDERDLGQDVTLSEIITDIQSIEGVVAVDIDALHFIQSGESREHRLVSNMARSGTETPKPAELVILQPIPFKFSELS